MCGVFSRTQTIPYREISSSWKPKGKVPLLLTLLCISHSSKPYVTLINVHFSFLTSKAIQVINFRTSWKSLMAVLQNHCMASALTKVAERGRMSVDHFQDQGKPTERTQ